MDQRQSAGRESTQVQVAGDFIVQQGLTETRAREIASETSREAVLQFTHEALGVATQRIDELDSRVVDTFAKLQILDAFEDPGFQRLLKKAQTGAACTERTSDIDLIVALLVDRVENSESRPRRASVDRAVEIVDQIDASALAALSVFFSISKFAPTASSASVGLDAMESLFSQFGVEDLPSDKEWLDHLDVLGAIRINPLGSLPNLVHLWTSAAVPGYVCEGIENPGGVDPLVVTVIPGLPDAAMVPHDLRPGYSRVPASNEENLRRSLLAAGGEIAERANEYIDALKRDFGFGPMHADCLPRFVEALDVRPSLTRVRQWWDHIGTGLSLTGVGTILAKANVKRLHKGEPLPGIE